MLGRTDYATQTWVEDPKIGLQVRVALLQRIFTEVKVAV